MTREAEAPVIREEPTRRERRSEGEGVVEAFVEAERVLYERLGVTGESSYMTGCEPPVTIRLFETGQGVPALLVHGGGTASFGPLLPHLRGIRSIVPDRPGHGLSGAVDYKSVDYRRYAVGFFEAILDRLELDRIALVGTSGGSLWSFWFALTHPERVTAMIHLGAPALLLEVARPPGETPSERVDVTTVLQRFGHERSLPRILPEFITAFERAGKLPDFRTAYQSQIEVLLPPGGTPPDFPITEDDLRSLEQPNLLVWGGKDPFGNLAIAERAADFLPAGELVFLPDAGHLPWLDHPEVCGSLVSDFIRRHSVE